MSDRVQVLKAEIKQIIKGSLTRQFAKGSIQDGTYIYYSEPIANEILSFLASQGLGQMIDGKFVPLEIGDD